MYLLLDTSGSMRGEPIQAVNTGLKVLVGALRQDPYALETVHMCIITFDARARVVLPLSPLDQLHVPEITTPQSGPTHLGEALETLVGRVRSDIRGTTDLEKGDWSPYLFVMTDGKPSDTMLFQEQCRVVKTMNFASIIGCVAGPKAQKQDLEGLCTHIVSLDTMDNASFTSLFKWVTAAIASGNRSLGATESVALPPPPPEIQVFF